jgi:hypothetical protein
MAMNITVKESTDPVFAQDGQWYFWDEAWYDHKGPYRTEELARAALLLYCEFELEGAPQPQWS